MINFASNLNKMIDAGLGGPLDPPRTEVAVGHRVVYTEVSGDVVNFETNVIAPVKNLRVTMEPIQEGTGNPSPDNIRPITGRDSVNIWNAPTHDTTLPPTVTTQLGTTVYGGTVDVTGGSKTESKRSFTYSGTEPWYIAGTGTNRIFRLAGAFSPPLMSANVNTYIANWAVKTTVINNLDKAGIDYWAFRTTATSNNTHLLVVAPTANVGMTLAEFKEMLAANPLQIVADIETPVESSVEPATLSTLKGQNNVWSDAGNISLKYPYYEETEGY